MNFPKLSLAAILIAGLISLCACRQHKASNLPIKQYDLHGRVMRLNPQDHTAVINGQEVKGWMGAMTMEYPVKPVDEFSKLNQGENIGATLYVQGTDYWIGAIRPEAAPSK